MGEWRRNTAGGVDRPWHFWPEYTDGHHTDPSIDGPECDPLYDQGGVFESVAEPFDGVPFGACCRKCLALTRKETDCTDWHFARSDSRWHCWDRRATAPDDEAVCERVITDVPHVVHTRETGFGAAVTMAQCCRLCAIGVKILNEEQYHPDRNVTLSSEVVS